MTANSQPIQRFVQSTLSKGMQKKDIKSTLVQAGWPSDIVTGYLEKSEAVLPVPSGKAAIRVQGISKSFGKLKILNDLSLEIRQGEIFGIIGASGTGKSTLLNIIMGVLAPDSGDVLVALTGGMASVSSNPEKTKMFIGFSTQDPSFYGDLTVEENLVHFSLLYGKTEKQARLISASLSKLVGLQESIGVKSADLSGGMKKRLDIACSLVQDPKVLLLDEPVSDLDVLLRTQLWGLLKDIKKKGTTIIICSHFLTELEKVCDRMGILRNGRVAEVGTPDELRVIYSHNFEIRLETRSRSYNGLLSWISGQPGLKVAKTRKDGAQLVIQTAAPDSASEAIMQFLRKKGDSLVQFEVGRPTIRDLFESLLS